MKTMNERLHGAALEQGKSIELQKKYDFPKLKKKFSKGSIGHMEDKKKFKENMKKGGYK